MNPLCKNCWRLESEHPLDIDNNFFRNCPTGNGGYYLYIGFIPMTNLEYLEMKYEKSLNG